MATPDYVRSQFNCHHAGEVSLADQTLALSGEGLQLAAVCARPSHSTQTTNMFAGQTLRKGVVRETVVRFWLAAILGHNEF